jgi:hypothetical protein
MYVCLPDLRTVVRQWVGSTGRRNVGIISGPRLVDDLWPLAERFETEFVSLAGCADDLPWREPTGIVRDQIDPSKHRATQVCVSTRRQRPLARLLDVRAIVNRGSHHVQA